MGRLKAGCRQLRCFFDAKPAAAEARDERGWAGIDVVREAAFSNVVLATFRF